MHPVTGIQKIIQHLPHQTVVLGQVVHGGTDRLAVGAHQMRGRLSLGLGLDVGRQRGRAVLDALSPLRGGACCWHKAR